MSRLQRIQNVAAGLVMLVAAMIFLIDPEDGCYAIAVILGISLILMGVRALVYYFAMARHMVGGKFMLFIGIFLTDFGTFTMTIIDEARLYVIMYLIGWYAFAGLVKILRAAEARRYKASSWRRNAVSGAVNLVIAGACCALFNRQNILVYIYSFGMIFSAVMRIAAAFRQTSIVYIQ